MNIEVRAFLNLFFSALAIILAGFLSLVMSLPVSLLVSSKHLPVQKIGALGIGNRPAARKLVRRLLKGVKNGRAILAETDETGEEPARGLAAKLQRDGVHAQAFFALGQEELCLILEDLEPDVFVVACVSSVDPKIWHQPLMTVVNGMRQRHAGLIIFIGSDTTASAARVYSDGLRGLLDADGVRMTFASLAACDFDEALVSAVKSGQPLVMHPLSVSQIVSDTLEPSRLYFN